MKEKNKRKNKWTAIRDKHTLREWLRNFLKNILSEQFDAGNLWNSGQSKQLFRQLRHEEKLKKPPR